MPIRVSLQQRKQAEGKTWNFPVCVFVHSGKFLTSKTVLFFPAERDSIFFKNLISDTLHKQHP